MSFRAHGDAILIFIMQKDHADRKFLVRTMQIINSWLIMQKSASYVHAAQQSQCCTQQCLIRFGVLGFLVYCKVLGFLVYYRV